MKHFYFALTIGILVLLGTIMVSFRALCTYSECNIAKALEVSPGIVGGIMIVCTGYWAFQKFFLEKKLKGFNALREELLSLLDEYDKLSYVLTRPVDPTGGINAILDDFDKIRDVVRRLKNVELYYEINKQIREPLWIINLHAQYHLTNQIELRMGKYTSTPELMMYAKRCAEELSRAEYDVRNFFEEKKK